MQITTSSDRRQAAAIAALLSVVLNRRAEETLGQQLYLRIRELILSGRLPAGVKLPASRAVADDLAVSRTVSLTAYGQLVAEGYLRVRRGSGHYVQALNRRPPEQVRSPAPPLTAPRATPRGRPFDPDAPASALFPTREWARLMARGWRREGAAAAGFEDWAGLRSLRAAIASYLRGLQGLDLTADQVVVTSGTADALQLIARALGAAGDEVWVEDPGHVGARQVLQREGLRVVPTPVDSQGLDILAGRRLAPRARFALVTPARQFPSGAPLSLSRRVALIDWAHETGAVVIADDYDSELRFAGRPTAALASLDSGEAVLTVGGFSKLTFPGLRLGYVAGPASLIERLVAARARDGTLVATSGQPALADFIAGGGLARHLRALRREMGLRRAALAGALHTRLGKAVAIRAQEVGLHLSITLARGLAPGVPDVTIAALAAARGLSLDPLSNNAHSSDGVRGFLLGYAAWDEAELRAAVDDLASLLEGL